MLAKPTSKSERQPATCVRCLLFTIQSARHRRTRYAAGLLPARANVPALTLDRLRCMRLRVRRAQRAQPRTLPLQTHHARNPRAAKTRISHATASTRHDARANVLSLLSSAVVTFALAVTCRVSSSSVQPLQRALPRARWSFFGWPSRAALVAIIFAAVGLIRLLKAWCKPLVRPRS